MEVIIILNGSVYEALQPTRYRTVANLSAQGLTFSVLGKSHIIGSQK